MAIDPELLKDMAGTLRAGRYSLLLGAGASSDSRSQAGEELMSPELLRLDLIDRKKLKHTSSLARSYAQLAPDEVEKWITRRFEHSTPGEAAKLLTGFYWKRIYTLNIDDSLEAAYTGEEGVQRSDPITYLAPYSTDDDPGSVQIVHIHGWARRPDDGYVFSLPEYASTMGPGNPWVHVLAQTLATDPFIVAGTSLEEPDIEYFLSGRRPTSVRADRGPSFLVEPHPDPGTKRDCARHGLNLYQGTLTQFLREIGAAFPERPIPLGATKPLSANYFTAEVTPKELALLARDLPHEMALQAVEDADLAFYVGREPTVSDIALARDISRESTLKIKSLIRNRYRSKAWSPHFIYVEDTAGAGKTTILSRVAYDLAAEGFHVFTFPSLWTPDLANSAKLLTSFRFPFVIIADNFADNVGVVTELYRQIYRDDFLILCADRSYRTQHVYQSMGGFEMKRFSLDRFSEGEANELIAKMDGYGLTSGKSETTGESSAKTLLGDFIAIAVCRIMNDYRPVEKIIELLIRDADENEVVEISWLRVGVILRQAGCGVYDLVFVVLSRRTSRSICDTGCSADRLLRSETKDYVSPRTRLEPMDSPESS